MEKLHEIVVATQNTGKVKEIAQAMAHLSIKVLSLSDCGNFPEPIEDGLTFEENAIIKARHYACLTGKTCLADDSGLEVDALAKAPGVYSARYAGETATDEENNRKLLQELEGVPPARRTGRFRCVLALATPHKVLLTVDGTCEGSILLQAEGDQGFGYDPLFFMTKLHKTLAQITVEEKNKISHRGQALKKFIARIQENH